MADIPYVIDVYRDQTVALPAFIDCQLTKDDINKRFAPQIKNPRPERFPRIALIYDFNTSETWADIDSLDLYFDIAMKEFEQVQKLHEAIRFKFHMWTFADAQVTIYRSWHMGGPTQPAWDPETSTWRSILKFWVTLSS